jgi:beta-barrel assembly-enhancing protease
VASHAVRLAVLAGLLLTAPVLRAQVRLPAMGEGVSAGMPLTAERRLGDQIWIEVRRDPSYLDDPVLADYLNRLWWPLVDAAVRRGEISDDMRQLFPWQAFLIRDRSINAFALPGGYVGVHLGLIAGTASRDELVSVLAHELAHVTQRHIARSIESSGRQSALGVATMLLGMIAASRSNNPDVAKAAIAGGQAAMIQGQLNFSRDMEREADRIGHTLMSDAGFLPGGMVAMFDKLDKANRLNDSGNFPYLRSHPLTADRIAEAQARAGLDAATRAGIDEEHELMRTRARILADPNVPALRSQLELFRSTKGAMPVATAYGAALAALLLKDEATVREALPQVLRATTAPGQRWARLLQTEGMLVFPQLGAQRPGVPLVSPQTVWQRPELALVGRAVLARPGLNVQADPDFRELHEALRSWVIRHPQDGLMWQLLGDCEAARGNRLAMLRATAEVHLAAGRPDNAMLTLQSARRSVRAGSNDDAVELAVIDARLADLRRQRADLYQRQGLPDPGEREKRDDFTAGQRK